MHFIDVNTGWFTLGGIITKTTNGGLNWQTQVIANSFISHKIFFIDQYTGWDVGLNNISQNIVLKSTTGGTTFINSVSVEIPTSYSLSQNYPNPFNPSTKIRFSIVSSPRVSGGDLVQLKVYDVMGREVQALVNESVQPGTYEVTFDGSMLNSGVYFYKLTTGGYTDTKKMLMIK